MKFLRSAVVSLLALGCVSLVSCSKEDGKGSGEPGGSFTVDGKAYKVAKAYMTYYGEKGAAENRWGHVDLWFDFDESGNQESGVELDFAVPEGAAKLTAGTYPYDMDGDTPAPCYFDGDVWDDDLDLSGTIAKGRVIVSVSGDTYTIRLENCIIESDYSSAQIGTISGSYTGPLLYDDNDYSQESAVGKNILKSRLRSRTEK